MSDILTRTARWTAADAAPALLTGPGVVRGPRGARGPDVLPLTSADPDSGPVRYPGMIVPGHRNP
jgi:hypothetical protein